MRRRIKICCIASLAEAQLAMRAGAHALGLVSAMPSGPGAIPEERIAEIARAVPASVETFLLTSRTEPAEIVAQQRRCGATTLQLCDALPEGAHRLLRRELPGVALVQVVHVSGVSGAADAGAGAEAIAEARAVAPEVDALLLDTGDRSAPVKVLGGTGRTHDWALSAEIVRAVRVPVYLAGGLAAANVGEAIRRVKPFGVDLCSGVRSRGALDAAKLTAFMSAVAAAEVAA